MDRGFWIDKSLRYKQPQRKEKVQGRREKEKEQQDDELVVVLVVQTKRKIDGWMKKMKHKV